MSISISRNRYIGDSDLPAQARTPRAMGTPEWGPLASSHGNWLHEAGRAVNLAGRACAGERLSREGRRVGSSQASSCVSSISIPATARGCTLDGAPARSSLRHWSLSALLPFPALLSLFKFRLGERCRAPVSDQVGVFGTWLYQSD